MKRRNITGGFIFVLASAGVWAQTLLIPPSMVTRGGSGSLLLTLESPQGKAPLLALQWEFTFPPNVAVDVADIVAGSAAESAQKTLTCRPLKTKDGGPGSVYGCILAGGQKALPNGPMAVVRYRVPPEIRQIAERVRVAKALGVTADLKSVELASTQAAITVK
jgi:hypothetical protein